MFRSNNGGPVPPGEDGPAGAPIAVPEVPALRQFVLHRRNACSVDDTDTIETINIAAHEVEINVAGNILRFREFIIHPSEGPTNKVVRCFNGWLDYEELLPVASEPSRLITPFSGTVN